MSGLGEKFSKKEIEEMIKDADLNGDGIIMYEGIIIFNFLPCNMKTLSPLCGLEPGNSHVPSGVFPPLSYLFTTIFLIKGNLDHSDLPRILILSY